MSGKSEQGDAPGHSAGHLLLSTCLQPRMAGAGCQVLSSDAPEWMAPFATSSPEQCPKASLHSLPWGGWDIPEPQWGLVSLAVDSWPGR